MKDQMQEEPLGELTPEEVSFWEKAFLAYLGSSTVAVAAIRASDAVRERRKLIPAKMPEKMPLKMPSDAAVVLREDFAPSVDTAKKVRELVKMQLDDARGFPEEPEMAPFETLTDAEADRVDMAFKRCLRRGQLDTLVKCVGEIISDRLREAKAEIQTANEAIKQLRDRARSAEEKHTHLTIDYNKQLVMITDLRSKLRKFESLAQEISKPTEDPESGVDSLLKSV